MADAPAPTPDTEQQAVTEQQAAAEVLTSLESEPSAAADTSEAAAAEISSDTAVIAAAEPAAAVEAEPETEAEAAEPAAATPEPIAADLADPVVAAPNVVPAPAPVSSDSPSLASTVEVPASAASPSAGLDGEGGEFELLLHNVRQWIGSGQLQTLWAQARTPLSLVAGLIGLLLVLRVYGAVLAVIEGIPLLPGLLELAGLIAVVQFSLTRLVRSNDRRQVIEGLRQRWNSFRGRG